MDIQVLNLCNKLDTNTTISSDVASIRATLRNISIEGALSILEIWQYDRDEVYLAGDKWHVRDLMNAQWFPEFQGRFADEVGSLTFWGGPPTKLKWYKGTLETLLLDRVLYEINSRGIDEIRKLIGTDLEGLKNEST